VLIALYLVGAALELTGIALVGFDVRESGRQRADMARPEWPLEQPQDRSLFEWMAMVAAGNVRRRAFGVLLFAVGVAVQTAGNIAAL
jgi:hypothetical protein